MSNAFHQRLRAASVDLDLELAEAWEQALGDYVENSVSTASLPDLVRLAFARQASLESAEVLRQACSGAGERQVAHDEDLLISLLATQALISVFDRLPEATAVQAGLLVRAASDNDWSPAHADLPDQAAATISEAAIRAFTPANPPRAPGQPASMKKALEDLATADWEIYRNALNEMTNEITRLRNHSNRLSAHLRESQRSLQEQGELAWWILSAYSITVDSSFADLPPAAAPAILAADLIRIAPGPPGPYSAPALLSQAIAKIDPDAQTALTAAQLADAIAELDLVSVFPLPPKAIADFLPLLAAIHSTEHSLAPSAPIKPERVATRTHNEILLASYDD
jgi:GTPase-associated system helical domain